MGGWGLLDLRLFGKALLCKTLWRGIFEERPWSKAIQKKYLGRKDLSHWFRLGRIGSSYGSPIWLSLRKIESFFLENLIWRFQYGKKILIGKDFFSERLRGDLCSGTFTLFPPQKRYFFSGMV